jgi:hypothetical protein
MSAMPAETVVAPATPSKPRAAKKADPAAKKTATPSRLRKPAEPRPAAKPAPQRVTGTAAKKTAPKPAAKVAKKLTAAEERAVSLAKEAGAIASGAGLKSAYLPQDAAAFLAEFKISRDGQTVTLARKGKSEPGELKLPALKRFVAAGGEPEVSKVFRALCRDSRLYGRKAGAFCLAALAAEEGS